MYIINKGFNAASMARPVVAQTWCRRAASTQTNATVTRLSKHLELHQYHPDTTDSGEPRPLLVFLPWMNASKSQASRYQELYAARGFNVLTVWGKLSYFLWPRWALPLATELANYLESQTKGPLIVHGMSVGAYLYAVTLALIAENPEKYGSLISRVRGHVYDSIVIGTFEEMAHGVAVILAPKSAVLQQIIKRTCLTYFAATRQHTIVPYERFIDAVFNSPVPTPKLCFYSHTDALCRPEAMERLINHWRNEHNLDVTHKAWEKSPHAAHLRTDPDTYNSLLDAFMRKTGCGNISPHLSSKI